MMEVEALLVPCEVTVKCVVPVIRAMVAEELVLEYGLKQEETGSLLGITQAAVSQYLRQVRGTALDLRKDEEIENSVKAIAAMLHGKDGSPQDLISKICSTCEVVRRKGLMCALHERLEPSLNVGQCQLCLE